MYADGEPIPGNLSGWEKRRKAMPCRSDHKALTSTPSADALALVPKNSLQRRGSPPAASSPSPPCSLIGGGGNAAHFDLAELVRQGEMMQMHPFMMIQFGVQMGAQPIEVANCLSDENRAMVGLPPKSSAESAAPVIQLCKGAAKTSAAPPGPSGAEDTVAGGAEATPVAGVAEATRAVIAGAAPCTPRRVVGKLP